MDVTSLPLNLTWTLDDDSEGVAGAALTNPLDVIRNEMFKTEESATLTVQRLFRREGFSFLHRGLGRNLLAVAAPIGMTIFLTDFLMELRHGKADGR